MTVVDRIHAYTDHDGLPTPSEAESLFKALCAASDELEKLARRIEGVADSEDGPDRQAVTFAQMGIVASIASDADFHVDSCERIAAKLHGALDALNALRADQAASAAPDPRTIFAEAARLRAAGMQPDRDT